MDGVTLGYRLGKDKTAKKTREEIMKNRLWSAAAAVALVVASTAVSAQEVLRLSHQWSNKDIRHQVAQIVADEVAAANVDLEIKIFGSK